MTSYKCQAPKCVKQIEFGLYCDSCGAGFLEDILIMSTPPTFFWRVYDFIATKIDNIAFGIEYIHDKRKYRRNKKSV